MRTMFWCSLLSAALAAGACKKSQDDTGKAAKDVKKTQENVQEQRKDLEKTTPDHETKGETPSKEGETQRTPSSERDTDQKESDQAKKQADLEAAQADAKAAKDKYAITVKDRLSKIDIRLRELQQRGDAKSRDAFTQLRDRRNAVATEANQMKSKTSADWDAFTKDVDSKLDSLEKDVNDAVNK